MIYFVQAGNNGPIKIGCTGNSIDSRIGELQTGCPYELKLLWSIEGDTKKERAIQGMWEHERIRGEWFRPSRPLLDYIEMEASSEWTVHVKDREITVRETMDEINIDGSGWELCESKDEQLINLTYDEILQLDISISDRDIDFVIDVHPEGIQISSKTNDMFRGVTLFFSGNKVVNNHG